MPKIKIPQEDPTSPFVYVELYIMLGDADGSIKGHAILSRSEWESDMFLFKKHLDDEGLTESKEMEYEGWCYNVDPSAWTVKSCTADETATLKKFLGKDYAFKLPSYYIEE